jgi:5'-methylthioadenosine phosphorylase
MEAEIGIIGGSGVYRAEMLEDIRREEVCTAYGRASVTLGLYEGRRVAFIARHGEKHSTPPHRVNYRANIKALESLGVGRVIATCAVGSLRDDYEPGDIVVPDQFIDFTKKRDYTFYDNEAVHLSMADPFCPSMREESINVVKSLGFSYKERGTYVCIEGPRFSTRAESRMFRTFGDIIGMTLVPECQLARELGMCYLCLSMITDYDVYGEKPVSALDVRTVMERNAERVQQTIERLLKKIPAERDCGCGRALEEAR